MSDSTKKSPAGGARKGPPASPIRPSRPKPGEPGDFPGQAGQQPGDTWGDDNPGNVHAVGVGDHVFFHREGKGPHAGCVASHGVHGCLVDDHLGERHSVPWGRVLGLKTKAVLPAKVVDRGVGGSILEHPDGRRVFVAGELPIPDEPTAFSKVADLERRAGMPRARVLEELEPFARAAGRELAKADHECEGPALCPICRGRAEEASLVKSLGSEVAALEARVAQLRGRVRSLGAGSRPLPVLLRPR